MKQVLARHKWLLGCTISEVVDTKTEKRHFVATVEGWNGFYIGYISTPDLIEEVKHIREKIKSGDDSIFTDSKYYKENLNKWKPQVGCNKNS